MRIVFARHGESEANLVGLFSNRGWKHPLTPHGRQQALELANHLTTEVPGRIAPISDMGFKARSEAQELH